MITSMERTRVTSLGKEEVLTIQASVGSQRPYRTPVPLKGEGRQLAGVYLPRTDPVSKVKSEGWHPGLSSALNMRSMAHSEHLTHKQQRIKASMLMNTCKPGAQDQAFKTIPIYIESLKPGWAT